MGRLGRLSWGAATLAVALLAAPAIAGAQPWQPQANWSWTGAYGGLNIGAVSNTNNGQNTCWLNNKEWAPGCDSPFVGKTHSSGFLGGATLGYNLQAGPLVIGIEADYDDASMQGSYSYTGDLVEPPHAGVPNGTLNASASLGWLATERLRVGFATSRGAMVYFTGGLAQAQWQVSGSTIFPTITYQATQRFTNTGWAEGLGYEAAIAPRMTMRIEALEYELNPYSLREPVSVGASTYQAGQDFQFHGWVARLGANWKF